MQYFQDISDGVDGPVMVYNWPHGTSVDIGPDLAERIAAVDNVVAIKDSRRTTSSSSRRQARARERTGLRPVHERRRPRLPPRARRRRVHRRRLALGRPDSGFWEAVWRGNVDDAHASTRGAPTSCPEAWVPGGWGGQFGAYQSQLKVLMGMLGQPGRRPPAASAGDRQASLSGMREIIVEAGSSRRRSVA